MTFNYNRDIPDGPHNPSSDVTPMKINTNAIDDLLAVDHVSFNLANGGIHKQVNMANESSPTRLADLVLYARLAGGVSSLWAKNATNDLPLFTGPASGAANGYTSIYGGMIVQWGSTSFAGGNSHETGTQNFPLNPFPNNCFVVVPQLQIASTATTTASNTIAIRSFTTAGFTWVFNSSSASGSTQFPGFYWIAIGN